MRFKKLWLALGALVLWAEPLWKFIKWIADWRGRVDVISETYHEIGGVDSVIGYILNPPPWFDPLAIVAGLFLIWYMVRPRQGAPGESSRSKLATWGPWILIVGAPVLGLFWLYWNYTHPVSVQNKTEGPPNNISAQLPKLEDFLLKISDF